MKRRLSWLVGLALLAVVGGGFLLAGFWSRPLWTAPVADTVRAACAVDVDSCLMLVDPGLIVKVDRHGAQQWQIKLPALPAKESWRSLLAAPDGVFYAAGDQASVVCLTESDGVRWQQQVPHADAPRSLQLCGVDTFGNLGVQLAHRFFWLDQQGKIQNTFELPGAHGFRSGRAAADGSIYYIRSDRLIFRDNQPVYPSSAQCYLVKLRRDGHELWRHAGDYSSAHCRLTFDEAGNILAVRRGALDKFDAAGTLLWTGSGPFSVFERPAVARNAVYLTGGQSLHAWDPAGRLQWIYSTHGAIYEVAAHDDCIAVLVETPGYSDRLASWLKQVAPKAAKALSYELHFLTPAGQLKRRVPLGSPAGPVGYASFELSWPQGAFLVKDPDGSIRAYGSSR